MKFVLFSLCIFTFAFLTQSRHLTDDLPLGFSHAKITALLQKAVLGFRHIMINGDQELEIPVMEPYNAGDFKWDCASKSEKLGFHLQNITYQGLTDFKLRHISTRPKDLKFVFAVLMEAIQLQGPYKLNGHAFKQWLPIYGDGDLIINLQPLYMRVDVDLAMEKSKIVVEDVIVSHSFYKWNDIFQVSATNLMDLPSEITDDYLYELLKNWYYSHYYYVKKLLSKHAKKIVEDRIGGMTMDELFEFIDYLAQST